MSNKPDVSLIISCYNQPEYLERVLHSALNQSYTNFELIMSDDGSGDEVAKLIQSYSPKFKYPIKHIWHEDMGFRKTIIKNKAVRASTTDYLIFVDGDCIMHHLFVERHFKRKAKDVVLSGRRVMLSEDFTQKLTLEQIEKRELERPKSWLNHIDTDEERFKNIKRGLYLPFLFQPINFFSKSYFASGCNYSLFKENFMAVNGYNEDIIGWGYEDINISNRLQLKGYKIKKLTNEAILYHQYHSHSTRPMSHSEEQIHQYVYPKHYFTKNGIS